VFFVFQVLQAVLYCTRYTTRLAAIPGTPM
jgi:hypothetical protein